MPEYPKPSLAADIILFRYSENQLQTLLIKRKNNPFKDYWAYPGGFVDKGETALQAAYRELFEEVNIKDIELYELFADTEQDRDPRGWTISVVYYGFVAPNCNALAGDDAKEAKWFPVVEMPKLAFDHDLLYKKSMKQLKNLALFKVLGMELLPQVFSLNVFRGFYHTLGLETDIINNIISIMTRCNIIVANGDDSFKFDESNYRRTEQYGFLSLL